MSSKGMKLLGFRSGKAWKMVLAIVYYLALALFFVSVMISPSPYAQTYGDIIFEKVEKLCIFIFFISPVIVLSEFKIRNHLLLFRARKAWKTIVGFIILFIITIILVNAVTSLHSSDYKIRQTEAMEQRELQRQQAEEAKQQQRLQQEEARKQEEAAEATKHESDTYLDNSTREPEQKTAEETPKQKTAEEVKADYIEECKNFSYETVARDPNQYVGAKAVFNGKVVQVMESGDRVTLLIGVTKTDFGYEDIVYVDYTRKDKNESRILEDDIVTVYGEMNGLKKYISVMFSEENAPWVNAKYIDIQQ
ncbi:hypothetical protein LI291_10710 [Intestinibacillus massiliensis]|nr:hypothetical protein [Intestinibacillus massiliensis]